MLSAILLFLIGVVAVLYSARSFSEENPAYVVGLAGAFALFAAVSIVVEGRKRRRFVRWLADNRNEVESFGKEFEGQRILNRTELRDFHLAFSVIAFSFRTPSRYFTQSSRLPLTAIVYSLVSVTCGWWGIPHGPIFTLQALSWNLRGGRRLQVWQIYEELDLAEARRREIERLKKRPFWSAEMSGTHKVALVVVIVGALLLLYAYLSGQF